MSTSTKIIVQETEDGAEVIANGVTVQVTLEDWGEPEEDPATGEWAWGWYNVEATRKDDPQPARQKDADHDSRDGHNCELGGGWLVGHRCVDEYDTRWYAGDVIPYPDSCDGFCIDTATLAKWLGMDEDLDDHDLTDAIKDAECIIGGQLVDSVKPCLVKMGLPAPETRGDSGWADMDEDEREEVLEACREQIEDHFQGECRGIEIRWADDPNQKGMVVKWPKWTGKPAETDDTLDWDDILQEALHPKEANCYRIKSDRGVSTHWTCDDWRDLDLPDLLDAATNAAQDDRGEWADDEIILSVDELCPGFDPDNQLAQWTSLYEKKD